LSLGEGKNDGECSLSFQMLSLIEKEGINDCRND
jgi:hypothetical protein